LNQNNADQFQDNKTLISNTSTAEKIDSSLIANNRSDVIRDMLHTMSIMRGGLKKITSIDADYGEFDNKEIISTKYLF
jgi:hypothetical protein